MNKKMIFTIVAGLLAFLMVFSGANKLFHFMEIPPPKSAEGMAFMMGMFGSYLGTFVAIVEIIGGILVVIPKTRAVGALVLLPVVVNILLFHLAHDMTPNMWIGAVILAGGVLYSEKDRLMRVLED